MERLISEACDTSFLFWSRGLVPLILADCRGRWQETHQLHFCKYLHVHSNVCMHVYIDVCVLGNISYISVSTTFVCDTC
jgi:hypothetical protein